MTGDYTQKLGLWSQKFGQQEDKNVPLYTNLKFICSVSCSLATLWCSCTHSLSVTLIFLLNKRIFFCLIKLYCYHFLDDFCYKKVYRDQASFIVQLDLHRSLLFMFSVSFNEVGLLTDTLAFLDSCAIGNYETNIDF